jgi:hypothetical protein
MIKPTPIYISIAVAALILTVFIHPAPAGPESVPGPAVRLVSDKVAPGQGTVAWSPGGGRLAYVERKLVIEDLATGKRMKSPVKGVYYVRWIDDSSMLVLRRRKKESFASLLEASGKLLREAPLPVGADAAYPLKGFERLLLAGSSMKTLRIGIDTAARAGILDTSGGSYSESYSTSRIQPKGLSGREFIMGWSEAGPSPLDDALVLIDYKDPPALHPYVRVLVVDPATWEGTPLYRIPESLLGPGGGWSSGGDTLAIADITGTLKLIRRNGETRVPETAVRGFYPAWSPVADRICFGGHVLSPSGGETVKLRDGAEKARCIWRPGGRDLVLLSQGRLEHFTGVDEPDRDESRAAKTAETLKKVRLLRDLLEEGHVERKEYDMRLQRLTGIETVEVSR